MAVRAKKTSAKKSSAARQVKRTPRAEKTAVPAHAPSAHPDFMLKMEMVIPATAEAINPLVDAVMSVVRRMGHTSELEIETALREALANAVKHGCSGDASKFVECQVVFEKESSVFIAVRDPGPGFDPATIPDPTNGEHVYEDHGRGIFLINQLMDEVRFHRNGSEIHMRKF
ncbi:MAG TPA: ATP-binding protein [candidate division Zixibacteria bacterium]|nr:ATP-binding protein [candidate division Zixibacteria bacterium]